MTVARFVLKGLVIAVFVVSLVASFRAKKYGWAVLDTIALALMVFALVTTEL